MYTGSLSHQVEGGCLVTQSSLRLASSTNPLSMPIAILILKIIIFQIGVDIFSGGALHQGGGGHARAKKGRGAPFPHCDHDKYHHQNHDHHNYRHHNHHHSDPHHHHQDHHHRLCAEHFSSQLTQSPGKNHPHYFLCDFYGFHCRLHIAYAEPGTAVPGRQVSEKI